jgi:hypothetical protein
MSSSYWAKEGRRAGWPACPVPGRFRAYPYRLGEKGVIGLKRRADHGYFVDRQYEYLFVGDSHYHGFLSDYASECIDPLVEKRMRITA